jgi:hypothetical protein
LGVVFDTAAFSGESVADGQGEEGSGEGFLDDVHGGNPFECFLIYLPGLRAAVALGFRPQQHREHRLMSCSKVKKRL